MPPVPPPAPFPNQAAIAHIRDKDGKIIGTVTQTPEFQQWLEKLLASLTSAT